MELGSFGKFHVAKSPGPDRRETAKPGYKRHQVQGALSRVLHFKNKEGGQGAMEPGLGKA